MKSPTTPVPGKERITSRSTLGSVGLSVATLLHGFLTTQPGEIVGETVSSFSGNHLIALGVAAAIFAVGYLRDIAMAFIQAWGEARGVDFDEAQEQAREIGERIPPLRSGNVALPVEVQPTNPPKYVPVRPVAPVAKPAPVPDVSPPAAVAPSAAPPAPAQAPNDSEDVNIGG